MLTCRKTFIVLAFFISFKANSQKVYTAFPKTNYHFILPDSIFKVNYDSTGFFSEKYSSKISVEPFETGDGENDYHSLVKLLMLEISRQGTTILLDKELDSNHRVLKIKVDFEITDSRPYEKGVSNICRVTTRGVNAAGAQTGASKIAWRKASSAPPECGKLYQVCGTGAP